MNYYMIDNRLYGSDELYHHGVKGQKWGVRRYQNPDGTLTAAGKKRMAKQISSSTKNIGYIDTRYIAAKFIDDVKEIRDYKIDNKLYKKAADAARECRDFDRKNNDKIDRIYRDIIGKAEKKYGKYEDLELKEDLDMMDKFDTYVIKQKKIQGLDDLFNRRDQLSTEYTKAKKEAELETRKFTEDFLGRYGHMKLRGHSTAIMDRGKVINRKRVSDLVADTVLESVVRPHYSRDNYK